MPADEPVLMCLENTVLHTFLEMRVGARIAREVLFYEQERC
jgi:hypothetical protein